MARTYKTLGELVNEMRVGLGFAAAGSVAGAQRSTIVLHLQQAQMSLYLTHDWAHLRKYVTKTLGTDQYLMDYPADGNGANPDRVMAISVYRGGQWSPPIRKGIPPDFYTYQSNKSFPQRWEPYEQIEFYPIADQQYSVRIFYVEKLGPFTLDTHRASIDDSMIAQVALGTLKAHYRHPDAKIWSDRGEALLIRLKGKSWGQDVFRPDAYEEEPMVKPVTV